MNLLWGLLGIVVVLGIAFLLSSNKKAINLRTIVVGLAIQLTFAFVVLKWEKGKEALIKFTDVVQSVIDYAGWRWDGFCIPSVDGHHFLLIFNRRVILFRRYAVGH